MAGVRWQAATRRSSYRRVERRRLDDGDEAAPVAAAAIADWRRPESVGTDAVVRSSVGRLRRAVLPHDLDCHHSAFTQGLGLPRRPRRGEYVYHLDPDALRRWLAPQASIWHMFTSHGTLYFWAQLDRKSAEYKEKTRGRRALWRALEAVVPDVRQRAEMTTIGTPLTHARFNNRHMGTYGPAGATVEGDLKGFGNGGTPVKGLWQVGDSQFPGIGLPAAAASGILVANALVSVAEHRALLNAMRAAGTLCAGSTGGARTARAGLEGSRRVWGRWDVQASFQHLSRPALTSVLY